MTLFVVGGPVLNCELVSRALDGCPRSAGREDVVVLVDPAPSDWQSARERDARIVLMTRAAVDASSVTEAILAGADAVVEVDVPVEQLREAVEVVAAGGTVLDPQRARLLADVARGVTGRAPRMRSPLTKRERDVLLGIANGQSVKQTARHLGIACKTVENVRGRLLKKLGARNGAQALVVASSLGVLAPGP